MANAQPLVRVAKQNVLQYLKNMSTCIRQRIARVKQTQVAQEATSVLKGKL